jgi:hypothetical protein
MDEENNNAIPEFSTAAIADVGTAHDNWEDNYPGPEQFQDANEVENFEPWCPM